ncbi:hypothetical protein F53441_10646 [Fusarium austroafricanum]|uniref:Uncharacterized protein n=1 Tax=Fusarium austroafricanum TaxID=2364996 RepID=A0A8H4K917_9HYPO|nr:hypothetical protein F53441_10646 [Fusarium austroafricanum]
MSNNGRGLGRGSLFQRGGRGGRGGGRGSGGLIGSAVRGVAGGIGLVSESVSSYKKKKEMERNNAESSEQAQQHQPNIGATELPGNDYSQSSHVTELPGSHHPQPSSYIAELPDNNIAELPDNHESHNSQQDDLTERQWELDETQSELLSTPQDGTNLSQETRDDHDLVATFLRAHGPVSFPSGQPNARLELPVILAQRRPKDRTRGFVRGYAPMLENVGIDQAAWLDFLDKFDESTTASPWIEVINFAEFGGFFVSIGPSIAISAAVHLTIESAKDVHSRQRTNKFLSQMNKQYFYPKGLCCLIMTWREDSGKPHEVVDLTSTIASSIGSYDSSFANKFKNSSGKTYGDFALPEAAPLIFPTLDVLAADDSEQSTGLKQSLGEKKTFIREYYDKRAQAQFALDRPNNLLANQQEAPKFTSRYADPSHPSNNGSLISLLTRGYVDPTQVRRQGLRGQISERRNQGTPSGTRTEKAGLPLSYKPVKAARKFLFNKDILYLMVVNMPTEDELNQAKVALNSK